LDEHTNLLIVNLSYTVSKIRGYSDILTIVFVCKYLCTV